MEDKRLKQLMEQVGFPNSKSLYTALRQCDMDDETLRSIATGTINMENIFQEIAIEFDTEENK